MTQLSILTVQQHMAGQTAVAASLSPMAQGTVESTVSALSGPENCARPSKPKRKLCEQLTNWYRRMSPSTRCASFQIVCQRCNAHKICIHPSKLQTLMKTRFLVHWLRIPTESAILLSHGALASLESAATSYQTWLPKNGQLWSRKERVIIMTQRK